MRVPARVVADRVLLDAIAQDLALEQLQNVATLPGIVDAALAMPVVHQGYGFPVGGVAATELPDGVVSPGGVGYDINCGPRLLALPISEDEPGGRREPLVHELSRAIPAGTGRHGPLRLDAAELDDLAHTESGGCLPGADPGRGLRARARARRGPARHRRRRQPLRRGARAMAAAANFAFANRQALAHACRPRIERVLGRAAADATRQVYDVAHDVAKVERHAAATSSSTGRARRARSRRGRATAPRAARRRRGLSADRGETGSLGARHAAITHGNEEVVMTMLEERMRTSIAKVIEITAESSESFEDAIQKGIVKASESVHGMRSAWVEGQQVRIEDGKVVAYRVDLKVTFVLD